MAYRRTSLALFAGELDEKGAVKTFTRWVNFVLQKQAGGRPVSDLATDFCDGVNLCLLLETLTNKKIAFHRNPTNKATCTENVHLALEFIEFRLNFKAYGLNVQDIETGNKKVLLGLLFQLANRFQKAIKDSSEATAKQTLLRWCKEITSSNANVSVNNFYSSFSDGLALCTILNHYLPGKIALETLSKENAIENLKLAFDIALAEGQIPVLLDPEDLAQAKKADDGLVMIYVSFFYNWLAKTSSKTTEGGKNNSSNGAKLESPPVPITSSSQQLLWGELVAMNTSLSIAEITRLLNAVALAADVDAGDPKLLKLQLDAAEQEMSSLQAELELSKKEVLVLKAQQSQKSDVNSVLAKANEALVAFKYTTRISELEHELSKLKAAATVDSAAVSKSVSMDAIALAAAVDPYSTAPATSSASAPEPVPVPAQPEPAPSSSPAPAVALAPASTTTAPGSNMSRFKSLPAPPPPPTSNRPSIALAAPVAPKPVATLADKRAPRTPTSDTASISSSASASAAPQSQPSVVRDSFIVVDPFASSEEENSDDEGLSGRRQILKSQRRKRVEGMMGDDESKKQQPPSQASPEASADGGDIVRTNTSTSLKRAFSKLRDLAPVTLKRVTTLPDVVKQAIGFRLEDGTNYPWWLNASSVIKPIPGLAELDPLLLEPLLENPEYDTSWYAKFFANREHHVFIGDHAELGSFVITAVREEVTEFPSDALCLSSPYTQVRVMVWLKSGIEKATIPLTVDRPSLSVAELLAEVTPGLVKGLHEVKATTEPKVPEKLIAIEEIQASKNLKFGVLYVKEGQTKEEDMFSNEKGSAVFDEFLNIIGTKIALKDWDKFRGGLDVKNGKTGETSVFTEFDGYDIMFHVSTMLPFNDKDPQQLERKRHIGNDICTIVFIDTPDHAKYKPMFSPDMISSHFLHVFIVVRPGISDQGKQVFTINVVSRDDVPFFGPVVRNPPIFEAANAADARKFILSKLINGETATYLAPSFITKMSRTLMGTLNGFADDFSPNSKSVKKSQQLSNIKPWQPSSAPAAPVSDIKRMLTSKKILQASTVLAELSLEVHSADKWGSDFLVAASEGLFFFDGAGLTEIKMDKKRKFLQVNVIQQLNIVVSVCVRVPGGHPYVVIFDLESIAGFRKSNSKVRENKIEETRSVNVYAIDPTWDASMPFYMVCAVKQKLWVFLWQAISKTFRRIKTFSLPDVCLALGLRGSTVVIGFPTGFASLNIDEARDNSTPDLVHLIDGEQQVDPLDFVHLEKELLLTYNNESLFVDFNGKQSREYVVKWTSFPHSVVYIHPFIVGLMRDSIEVRTLANGRLIQSLPLQSSSPLCDPQQVQGRSLYVSNNGEGDAGSTQIHRISFY